MQSVLSPTGDHTTSWRGIRTSEPFYGPINVVAAVDMYQVRALETSMYERSLIHGHDTVFTEDWSLGADPSLYPIGRDAVLHSLDEIARRDREREEAEQSVTEYQTWERENVREIEFGYSDVSLARHLLATEYVVLHDLIDCYRSQY
ncbi:hypothetical protein KIPB_008314 [Kipferlia bialata]|uniref:Uncharacterized protein n=1 Tax=Kipferlia bialata TaxID=797122 RepID=A0A9K3GKQ1_9EUKA|nr:hypothetical protein KIPB_008314 [Kipferlia bialata]|eukprot:g8314.t1